MGNFILSDAFHKDGFQYWFAQFFFTFATLFVLIVLLNLLISIVGRTFSRVSEDANNLMYADMVKLIVENQFLVYYFMREELNEGDYIILVVPEEREI